MAKGFLVLSHGKANVFEYLCQNAWQDWHFFQRFSHTHKKIHSRSSGAALMSVFASTEPSCLQGKWPRWLGKCQVEIQFHCPHEEPLLRPLPSWLPPSRKDCAPHRIPGIFHTTWSEPNKDGGTFISTPLKQWFCLP